MDVAFQKNLQNENEKCVPQTTFSDKMHNFPVFLFFYILTKCILTFLIFIWLICNNCDYTFLSLRKMAQGSSMALLLDIPFNGYKHHIHWIT